MNKKFKLLVKRVIAIVLMVLMLPISAMADSFSMVVHAQPAEDYESLTEDEFDESSLIAEEEIGTDDWDGEEDDSLQTNIDNLSENVQIGQEEGEKEKSSNEEMGENETENLILGTSLGNSENSDDEEESEDSNNNQLSEVIPETISATTKLCDDGSIMFSWASLEDDEFYYDVFRNQELIKTLVPDDYKKNPDDEDYDSNQISYTDENTEAAAEYTYYVVARKGEEKIAKCMDAVISMPNNLTITGDYTLTEDLTVYSIVQTAGTLNLNGHMLKVCKDYVNNTNWDGGIVFSNGAMECYGNFNIGGYYIPFKMASANDYLYVRGDFNMLSDYRNDFSNGMIETEGNFNAPYYRGSGYNKVVLRGSARQEIIVNQDCYFKNLSIQNYSEEGVNFTNPVQIGSYDDLTNIHVYINNKQTINGWTLEEDTVIEGDLCLGYGELNLNGNKLSITGNLYQVAGKLIVGDGELSIDGDYVLGTPQYDEENNVTSFKTGTGILSMQNEDGYVLVNGDFKTYSMMSESGYLSNGTMEIKGDFNIYSNNSQNFYTSGKHTVVFSGESEQTVSFATSNSSNSHFTNVINNNSSDEGLIFTDKGGSWPFANGTVKDNGRLIGGYISINGSTSFEDNHYCGSVVVSEDCTITKELMVEGNYWIGSYRVYVDAPIFVESDLYVESRYTYFRTNITVDGNMYFGGYYDYYIYLYLCSGETVVNGDCVVKLTSSWNTSTIQYEGNATFEVLGDVTLNSACYITGSNGVLKLHGNLTGNGQTSLNSNNKIVFCGDKKQSVAIAKNSTFGLFDILNESEEGVECDYLYSVGTLTRNGNKLSYKDSEGVFGWTLTEDVQQILPIAFYMQLKEIMLMQHFQVYVH